MQPMPSPQGSYVMSPGAQCTLGTQLISLVTCLVGRWASHLQPPMTPLLLTPCHSSARVSHICEAVLYLFCSPSYSAILCVSPYMQLNCSKSQPT